MSTEVTQAPESAYAAAGVSIDAGNEAVELMKSAVQSTYNARVLAGIGSFGGLFDAGWMRDMRAPVLVASTDGVGTKVKLAAQFGRFENIGHDIVNHCINDILVQGAKPLFFMDYFAASKLQPQQVAAVVTGIAQACKAAGCALLGGETAEMPGVYTDGAFDVAGTIVGVVERGELWPRTDDMRAGDVLIGLPSSGPHTNGYSLIRKVLGGALSNPAERDALNTHYAGVAGVAGDGASVVDDLLAPHRSYANEILRAKDAAPIKGLAHLTGGGFTENIPRVLPAHLQADVDFGAWTMPPIFELIQELGHIGDDEMHRVFNCGIGMVIVAAPEHVAALQRAFGQPAPVIGRLR